MANSAKKARVTDERPREGIALRLYDLRVDNANHQRNSVAQEVIAAKLSRLVPGDGRTVTGKRVSDWEGGLSEPSIDYIVGLAKIFNTTCDYLLTGVEPERVDASRRYGLSNDALAALEDLNSKLDVYAEIVEKGKYPYIRPVAFINTLLASEKLRAIAVDAIKLTYDRMLNEMHEADATTKSEAAESWEELVLRNWQDEDVIKAIFKANPHYSNKRIVDFHDYCVSKEYELNKRWSALLDEIASNTSLTPNGVIHSNRLERSWVGIPDDSDEGENANVNQEK